ncbi:hypothetical protein RI065_10025 [Mycoplasmatota bacterium zrk1]
MLVYKDSLSLRDKKTYEILEKGLLALKSIIEIRLSIKKIDLILSYVLLDNPMIFYVKSYEYKIFNNRKIIVEPQYLYSDQEIKHLSKEVLKFIDREFSLLRNMDTYMSELYIHDKVVSKIDFLDDSNFEKHTIIGPIFKKEAVCEGFSKFVKLTLNYVGIPCCVVTGFGIGPSNNIKEPHAWNIVEIDGENFHLDVTYNTTLSTNGMVRYDYFNLTDEQIEEDHLIECRPNISCKSEKYNYFSKNSLVIKNREEYEKFIFDSLKNSIHHFQFKIPFLTKVENIEKSIIEVTLKVLNDKRIKKSKVCVFSNPTQLVYEIIIQ